MANTDFKILLQTVLDKSGINTELKEVQNIINKYSVDIIPELKTTSLRNQMKEVSQEIANDFNKSFGTKLSGNDIFKAYENQAKQIIEQNKNVEKSFAELRKNTYQSIGEKSPELQQMAEMYKQEAVEAEKVAQAISKIKSEQDKLVQKSFTDIRKDAYQTIGDKPEELQRMAEMYRQEAIEADKVANAVQKINQVINSGNNEAKISQMEASFRSLGLSTDGIRDELSGINAAYSALNTSSDNNSLISNAKLLDEEYKKVQNRIKLLSADFKGFASESQRLSMANSMTSWLENNSKAGKEFGSSINQMINTLKTADNLTIPSLKKIETEFGRIQIKARDMGLLGKTVGDSFKDMTSKFGSWLLASGGVMTLVAGLRKMNSAVIEIDTAMTNLYKVTDETDSKYSQFLKNANVDAQKLGMSVSSLVEQTATWAKLGYGIDQASELAKISSIYKNVGEVDDDAAVSDLVTAMKSFNIEASDSITIVDSLNKLGNEFATDAASLGEGLKNSASALNFAGNDINQTLAMLTGGTEIIQNAGEMGNALKVLSMRIQGMKGKLEELGEEYENVESISKIQTQILNRTGGIVNIFDDAGNFKSTYEILKGISEVWDKISKTDQADLLEIIAGKQRGNQVSALIQSFQSGQVQKALDASLNSAGSANAEQEKWINSIQAKLLQLEASFQSLATTLIDSDLIKGFVDFGTALTNGANSIVKFLTPLGTLAAGIGALAANKLSLKGLDYRKYDTEQILHGSDKSYCYG